MKPMVPSRAEFNQQEISPLHLAHNQILLESHDSSPQEERNFDFRPPPSLLVALPAVIPHTHSRGSSGSGVLWLWLYLSHWETLGPCKLPPNPKPEGAGPALSRSTVSRSQRSKRSLRTLQQHCPPPCPTHTHKHQWPQLLLKERVLTQVHNIIEKPTVPNSPPPSSSIVSVGRGWVTQTGGKTRRGEGLAHHGQGPRARGLSHPAVPTSQPGTLLRSRPSIPSERNRSKLKFYTLKMYFPVEIISTMTSKTYIYNAKAPTHPTPVPKTIKGEL